MIALIARYNVELTTAVIVAAIIVVIATAGLLGIVP